MTAHAIRLLHVEDDRIQQALLARQLAFMQEFRFDITAAASEGDALLLFPRGAFDLVVLDYHLKEGNGLSCLRRLRQIDPLVPIIAVSSVASDETAAILISAGADDYLAKQSLDAESLGRSVRNSLAQAQGFRAIAALGI